MTDELQQLRELRDVAVDLDREAADRISARARGQLGRGVSPLRFVEPIAVALATSSILVWAAMKIAEVFR